MERSVTTVPSGRVPNVRKGNSAKMIAASMPEHSVGGDLLRGRSMAACLLASYFRLSVALTYILISQKYYMYCVASLNGGKGKTTRGRLVPRGARPAQGTLLTLGPRASTWAAGFKPIMCVCVLERNSAVGPWLGLAGYQYSIVSQSCQH